MEDSSERTFTYAKGLLGHSLFTGPLLVQKKDYHSVPLTIGIDLSRGEPVLPLDEFLENGQMRLEAHDAVDVTPIPASSSLQDDVVFVSQYVANRLGVRSGAILRMGDSKGQPDGALGVSVYEFSVDVPSAEWYLEYLGEQVWALRSPGLGFAREIKPVDGLLSAGPGTPTFAILSPFVEPEIGAKSTYQTFALLPLKYIHQL